MPRPFTGASGSAGVAAAAGSLTGSGAESIAWRAKQRSLIAQGKFDVAMKMDIGMIRKIHGTKYDAAIKEMVDHLPNNKNFQKYLSDNGWKLRTCLLK